MATPDKTSAMRVSVCYASPSGVWLRELLMPAGATVRDALHSSGFQAAFPGVDPMAHGAGVYGSLCDAETVLHDGARLEVYRPLRFDPKESRRRRAEHRRAKAAQATKGGRVRPAGLL